MADTKEKILDPTTASEATAPTTKKAASAPQTSEQAWNGKNKDGFTPYLPEETKFDRKIYGGISYGAQALTGILLTFFLRFTKGGQKLYEPLTKWVAPNFIEKISSKRGAEALKAAGTWLTVSTMVMVGNAFLLPVKWLENKKPAIIRKWTEKSNARREAHGETISPEERAQQETRLKEIENEPKQTWFSLLGGRVFGLGAVYAAVKVLEGTPNESAENFVAHAVSGTLGKVGLKKAASSEGVQNFSKLVYNDGFYSMISAGGLYVYSHFIHPLKKKSEVIERQEDKTAAPPMEKVDERIEEKLFSPDVRKGEIHPVKPREASFSSAVSKETSANQPVAAL